jgi:hypothetical protein
VRNLQPTRALFHFYNLRASNFKIRFVAQEEQQDQRQETEEARKTKNIEGSTREAQPYTRMKPASRKATTVLQFTKEKCTGRSGISGQGQVQVP